MIDTAHPIPDWWHEAACSTVEKEVFFPESGWHTDDARAICARCPVAVDCLTDALERGERFGIWGGHNIGERRRLRWRARGGPLRPVARAAVEELRADYAEAGS